MLQQIVVMMIVLACAAWLGFQAFRYLRPRPGGKACAGGCCDGEEKKPQATSGEGRAMMISSDDMRARIAARKKTKAAL